MTWGDLSDEEQIPHAHNLVEYWQECQRLVDEAHENGGDSLVADLVERRTTATDHRPRDRLGLLQPAVRRPRDHDDADRQHAAGAARAPRAVGATRRRPRLDPRRHRRGAALQRVDRRRGGAGRCATPRSAGSTIPAGREHPAADGVGEPGPRGSSPTPKPSTSTAPTPASTCRSASASTTASATCWPSCSRQSPCVNSRRAVPDLRPGGSSHGDRIPGQHLDARPGCGARDVVIRTSPVDGVPASRSTSTRRPMVRRRRCSCTAGRATGPRLPSGRPVAEGPRPIAGARPAGVRRLRHPRRAARYRLLGRSPVVAA